MALNRSDSSNLEQLASKGLSHLTSYLPLDLIYLNFVMAGVIEGGAG